MNNIIPAIIICYGLISMAIAISFVPEPISKSHEEGAARTIIITFWPLAIVGSGKLLSEHINQ